jgi:hypothetical protein
MAPWPNGEEHLLDEAINESEYAALVAETRANNQFLVRYYDPSSSDYVGMGRGPALRYTKLCLRRTSREQLGEQLAADPRYAKPEQAIWEFFNGQEWTPLLPDATPDAHQQAVRVAAIQALHRSSIHPDERLLAAGPLSDGFYVTSTARGGYVLATDQYPVPMTASVGALAAVEPTGGRVRVRHRARHADMPPPADHRLTRAAARPVPGAGSHQARGNQTPDRPC